MYNKLNLLLQFLLLRNCSDADKCSTTCSWILVINSVCWFLSIKCNYDTFEWLNFRIGRSIYRTILIDPQGLILHSLSQQYGVKCIAQQWPSCTCWHWWPLQETICVLPILHVLRSSEEKIQYNAQPICPRCSIANQKSMLYWVLNVSSY